MLNDKTIGGLWIERNSESKAILGIFIADAQYRGHGIGSAAIELAVKKTGVDELYLHVRTNNQRAINCYRKVGFTVVKQGKKDNGVEFMEMKLSR